MSKHKNRSRLKRQKPLIRQCVWCKKVLIKTGDYLTEGKEAFCGNTCLNEWKTRRDVVNRALDGQARSILDKRLKAHGLVDAPVTPVSGNLPEALPRKEEQSPVLPSVSKQDIIRGITVAEFLDGRSDEEIERLADQLITRRKQPWLNGYNIAITLLSLLLIAVLFVTYRKKERFYAIALDNKHKIEVLKKKIETGDTVVANPSKTESRLKKTDEKVLVKPRIINYTEAQPFVGNQYPENLNYTRGNPERNWVALTFDGSSHAAEARKILDTLKSRNAKATFFLTGRFIEKYTDIVRQMAGEGHVLGNHSLTHPHLTTYESNHVQNTLPGLTRERLQQELNNTSRIFEQFGLPYAPIWRAPYGEQNKVINSWAEELGLKHIGWTQGSSWRTNLDTNDWVERPGEAGFFYPDEVIKKVINFGKGTPYGLNGGILLMHIGTLRKDNQLYTKLGVLIDTLKTAGYQFVTIPEMLSVE